MTMPVCWTDSWHGLWLLLQGAYTYFCSVTTVAEYHHTVPHAAKQC